MRKITMALLLGSALAAGTTAVSSLYAQGSQDSSGPMMGHGMMGDGGDGMMGMMKMMRQMSQMMSGCNNMMSGSRPNEQWRKHAPSEPNQKS